MFLCVVSHRRILSKPGGEHFILHFTLKKTSAFKNCCLAELAEAFTDPEKQQNIY